jgi:hypothetical protein
MLAGDFDEIVEFEPIRSSAKLFKLCGELENLESFSA